MKNTQFYKALRSKKGTEESRSLELIGEEPLLIRVDDKPYSVLMRTPGDEKHLAAGFCLGEGIVDSPDDFETTGYDPLDPNSVDIWLNPERSAKIPKILGRRGFVSQTSCGICGKEMIKDIQTIIKPIPKHFEVDVDVVFNCVNTLSDRQQYYQKTRGSHAALIFDDQRQVISFAEDVGRHNALDKAIGKAFLNRTLPKANILVLSSRISYELVQKAARAQIPMMLSYSRPTAMAAEMGLNFNMTLAFPDGEELVIVCGENRIRRTN